MPRVPALFLFVAASLFAASLFAQDRRVTPLNAAGRRLALVIGNDQYSWSPLRNPVHDAEAVGSSLRQLGFDLSLVRNATLKQLQRASRDFIEKIRPGDVAFVFYSGHGMEVKGENYLIPVDFPATASELAVADEAYSAQTLLKNLDNSGARVKVVILDACRDNPLRASKSAAHGLGRMEGEGTLVVFATSAGRTADDNWAGQNGLFTTHLLRRLPSPGVSIDQVFKQVAQDVYKASGEKKQLPAIYGLLIEDFALLPTLAPASKPRTDGLYHHAGASSTSYLRFYDDGTVVDTSSTGTPLQVARWLSKTSSNVASGTFTQAGERIKFTVQRSGGGAVDYEGTLINGALELTSVSHINGHRSTDRYVFAPVQLP